MPLSRCKLPNTIDSSIKYSLQDFKDTFKYSEKSHKFQREDHLKTLARSSLGQILSKYLLRDQNYMFGYWKSLTMQYKTKEIKLEKLLIKLSFSFKQLSLTKWKLYTSNASLMWRLNN